MTQFHNNLSLRFKSDRDADRQGLIPNTVIAADILWSFAKTQIFLSFFLKRAAKTRRWKCAIL